MHRAAAGEGLVHRQAQHRFDAGRVAVHQQADRPGRGYYSQLGVAVSVPLAFVLSHRPDLIGETQQASGGSIAEGIGSNIFIVRDGRLQTPHERYVLPGVSRQATIVLAAKLGIDCKEHDIDVFDAANADEIFLTSTSLCICPVRTFNGQPIGEGKVPGPVTKRLMDAYSEMVGCDFVAQYLAHLN